MKYILRDYYLKVLQNGPPSHHATPCHRFTASILLPSNTYNTKTNVRYLEYSLLKLLSFLAIDDNEVEVTPKYTLSWFINKDVCHYFQLKVYTCSQSRVLFQELRVS